MRRAGLAVVLVTLGACTLVTTPPPPAPPADLPPPSSERPPTRPPPEPRSDPRVPEPPGVEPERVPVVEVGGEHRLPTRLPDEVRALWVVRTSLVDPESARMMVRGADAAGFNTLLVQVRGRGDAWYRSDREPRPIQLAGAPEDYDPLRVVLDEARARGMQVHAWVNAHVVASAHLPPTDPRHLMVSRPEWLAIPRELASTLSRIPPDDPRYLRELIAWTGRNDHLVEGIYTNPAHPEVQDHLRDLVIELVDRYPLDGVHLDYIRYPGSDFDYSAASLAAFRGWLSGRGIDANTLRAAMDRASNDPVAFPDAFPDEWGAFRREQVTALMERIFRAVRARDPEVVISAAVFADANDARLSRFQPWEEWLEAGVVDIVVPMAYTDADAVFSEQVRRAIRAGGPRRVWPGIGIYRNSFQGAVAKGRIARSFRTGGVALFSYDWAVGPEGAAAAGPTRDYLRRWALEGWDRP